MLRNGEPLAGAALILGGKGDARAGGTTDHEGGFRFEGIDDGSYVLTVITPAGARHSEKVEISGDQTIRVELRTASLDGRVVDAADASPVAGAGIFLQGADAAPPSSGATTDAHGVFHLLRGRRGELDGERHPGGVRAGRAEGRGGRRIRPRRRRDPPRSHARG